MVNKALRIVLYSIITISLLFVMPVNIYADSITSSNINGVSVVLDEVTFIENKTWTVNGGTLTLPRNYFNYNAEIQFDKSYLGYIDITISYTYLARNDTGMTYFNGTKVQKVFVNGDKAYLAFGFIANNSVDPLTYSSISYTLNSSDLIEYGLISDIQTIIDILQENQDIIIDIYSELQTVVSNTSLANIYLENISKIRDWSIPMESYPLVLYMLNHYEPVDFGVNDISYINNYPIFEIPSNSNIYVTYGGPNSDYYFIFISSSNIYNLATLKNKIGFSRDDVEFTSWTNLGRGRWWSDNGVYYMIKATIHTDSSNLYSIINISSDTLRIIPIYFGNTQSLRISTDFALQYGLTNQLLEDIHLIAGGTTASSAASSQSDQANQQLQTDSNTLFSQEDSFKQDMNSAMQNIDTTFSLNNFGSSFMTSAQWVRTQYETLTNNTPFASLITFSLLVGLALIVIGKVYK